MIVFVSRLKTKKKEVEFVFGARAANGWQHNRNNFGPSVRKTTINERVSLSPEIFLVAGKTGRAVSEAPFYPRNVQRGSSDPL